MRYYMPDAVAEAWYVLTLLILAWARGQNHYYHSFAYYKIEREWLRNSNKVSQTSVLKKES